MRRVQKVKDLGITFDQRITFHDHMMDIVKASYWCFGFIMRHSRQFSNPMSSRFLYNALVQSKLEYKAPVWNPHDDKYIEKVNKVFFRSLFKKEFGYYLHLYPTERLLDMLCYKSLELRKNISLLMRGSMTCPTLLVRTGLNVANNF
jgi:hypothetical protein